MYRRDKGLTELPPHTLNTRLPPLEDTIHAAKVRDSKRAVACTDRTGQAEWPGLFELWVREA